MRSTGQAPERRCRNAGQPSWWPGSPLSACLPSSLCVHQPAQLAAMCWPKLDYLDSVQYVVAAVKDGVLEGWPHSRPSQVHPTVPV
jgi:hypothetical protein